MIFRLTQALNARVKAGALEALPLAGRSVSFVKLWGAPTGMLTNIPAVATTR